MLYLASGASMAAHRPGAFFNSLLCVPTQNFKGSQSRSQRETLFKGYGVETPSSAFVAQTHCLPRPSTEGRSVAGKNAICSTNALLAAMGLTLKERRKSALLRGSYLSYNEVKIGLTVLCLSFYTRLCKLFVNFFDSLTDQNLILRIELQKLFHCRSQLKSCRPAAPPSAW